MKEKQKKWLSLVLALLLLPGLLSACGQKEEESGDIELDDTVSGETLTAGEQADHVFSLAVDYEQALNPITTKSQLNQMVGDLVYDRLFDVDEHFHVTSRILEDWEYVKGEGSSGVWVLTVRPDIQMHDGSLLTAEDITYSLSRVFTSGAAHYQLQMGRTYVSTYQGQVYLVGDYDNALMIAKMAVPIITSAPNSIPEDVPIGSGPYMYSEDRKTLVKFDGYENAADLPLDTIYLRQYEGPEGLITEYESSLVDIVINDPTNIYNMGYGGKNEKRTIYTSNMHFIGFNSESEFFRYEPYRQAMTYAFDRESLIDDVLDGAADASALPIHPNSDQFDANTNSRLSFNPQRALQELEKGGCRDLDADGMLEFALSGNKMEINLNFLVCADNASKVQAAEKIAADLRSIGIGVTVRQLSWNDYIAKLKGPRDEEEEEEEEWKWDMYYGEIALTGDWNTLTLFTGDWEKDGTLNYGKWALAELDSAVHAFMGAKEEDRADAESTMLLSYSTNAPFVTVCFERRELITHVGVITGIQPNQYNVFCNFANWKFHLDEE